MEFRQILDLTPQLVAVYGPNRERLYANRVMLDYLGLSLEEWRRRFKFGDALHPDDWERATGHFDRAVSSGAGFELELRLRKGGWKLSLVSGSLQPGVRRQGTDHALVCCLYGY